MSTNPTYENINERKLERLTSGYESSSYLLVITAEWLGEGTILDSIVGQIADASGKKLQFYRFEANDSKLLNQLGIRHLPCMLFFKNGELIKQVSGIYPQRIIEQMIREAYSNP